MLEDVKPFIGEQIKAGIAEAILEAKRRKGEYVAEAAPLPKMDKGNSIVGQRCNHPQADYETMRMGYCGKMAGHKLGHGSWIPGEAIEP